VAGTPGVLGRCAACDCPAQTAMKEGGIGLSLRPRATGVAATTRRQLSHAPGRSCDGFRETVTKG